MNERTINGMERNEINEWLKWITRYCRMKNKWMNELMKWIDEQTNDLMNGEYKWVVF